MFTGNFGGFEGAATGGGSTGGPGSFVGLTPFGSAPGWAGTPGPAAFSGPGYGQPGLAGLGGASAPAWPGMGLASAPSGPAPAHAVAATSRGGGAGASTPIVPTNLNTLLEGKTVPFGFREYLEVLGADDGVDTGTFLLVPEADLADALTLTVVDGVPLSAIRRARIIGLVREIFAECGGAVPAMGTASAPAPAAPRAGTPPSPAEPPTDLALLAPAAVSISQTVDQAIKGQARRLTFAELRDDRIRYEQVTGAAPPEHALPTGDQLAGLRALITDGRVPYVDFAVWSALGPRVAKFQKTEAAILVGGAFVTKVLDAPSTYAAWEDSWSLFAVAMVSLGAARPGSLAAYLDGIKTLHRHFPTRWPTIVAADLVSRSERWLRIREDIERETPAGFDPAAPWDYVIAASAYGRGGANSMWWHTHVELPLTLGVAAPFAGLPGSSSSSSSGPRAAPPPPPAAAGTRRAAASSKKPPSKEFCHSWNAGVGVCAGDGPCPAGRRHVCRYCGADHRAVHFHAKGGKGNGRSNKDKKKGQHRERRGNEAGPSGR